MYTYSFEQWLCFFIIYCFIGWCVESTYVSMHKRKFVNRGFMRGPYLPLYGSGAIALLFACLPVKKSIVLTFLVGSVVATCLEYVTGVVMEKLFKVRYWDYSDQKIQFQGHICLSSSIAWGFLAVVLLRFIHRPVEYAVGAIPRVILLPCLYLISIIMIIDFTLSMKAALDIRDIIVKLEKARKDMELLQKRLDVAIAFTENAITEEVVDLRERFAELRSRREQLGRITGGHKKHLLLNSPSIRSDSFKESLEILKKEAKARYREQTKVTFLRSRTLSGFEEILKEYLPDSEEKAWKEKATIYPRTFLVILHKKEVVGAAYGWARENEDRNRKTFVLNGIGVKDAYRRSGLGTRLLQAFERAAKEYGAAVISVGSAGGYVEKFYLNNGYQPTEYKIYTKEGIRSVKNFEDLGDYYSYERPAEDGFVVFEKDCSL